MATTRIIARLDIKGPNLVKGIHLEGLRVLGKPEDYARWYYEQGADELIFQDVVASLYERNSLKDIISATARQIFIPLTVGGGLRTLDDMREAFRAGADKVAINTAAIKHPELVREASRKFGSSNVVVAIEAIRQPDGRWLAYTDNGREHTGVEVVGWAQKVEEMGAGEIVITSVDHEGTGKGFDLSLTKAVAAAVGIPVIAHGGAGKLSHVAELIQETQVDAVAMASVFHYDYIRKHEVNMDNRTEGNVDFLRSGRENKRIDAFSIPELKTHLVESHHIPCRV